MAVERVYYPTAWVILNLQLEDFGQPDAERILSLAYHPLDLKVEINAFHEADTAEVTVDFEEFPFDPRILKGGTFEVYLADAGRVVGSEFWTSKNPDEMRALALFAGVIDEPQVTLDDRHRRIEIKGRDYTAYFLDAEVEGDVVTFVESGRKLSFEEILRRLVDQRDTTRDLEIDYQAPVIYPADYRRRADDVATGKRRRRTGEKVWDAVQEIAFEAGLVVYVELDRIVVREPSTIFLGGGDPERLIRWTVGSNVASLSMRRDLGRRHGLNVRVNCYDPDQKRTLVAYSPRDAADEPKDQVGAAKIGAAGDRRRRSRTTQTTVQPYVVRGISDQGQLQRIADQIREQLRHHELEGSIESDDLVDSYQVPVQQFRYGDPVVIEIAEQLQTVLTQPVEAQVRRLIEHGYRELDAQSIALSIDRLETPLYVHRAKHSFSTEGDRGYSLELEVRSRKQVDFGADRTQAREVKKSMEIEIEREG